MVAKIRLEAEDATKEAFDSVSQNAANAGSVLERVCGAMEKVGDSSASMSDQLDDSHEVLDGLSGDLDKVKSYLQKLSDSQKEAAGFDDLESSMEQTQAAATLLANGFTQSEVAAMSMDERLQQADKTFNELNAILAHVTDNLIDVERELTRVAEEEYRAAAAAGQAAHGIGAMGNQAAQSAANVREMDGALKAVHWIGGKFLDWLGNLWSFEEIFNQLAQGAQFLAEKGSPAFVELQEKGEKLFNSLVQLAELEMVQQMAEALATGFGELADFIDRNSDSIDELMFRLWDLIILEYDFMELTRQVPKGTTDMIRMGIEMTKNSKEFLKEQREAARLKIQEDRQNAEIDKKLHELEMERAAAKEAATTKQISDLKELARLQEAEVERVRKLAKEGKATEEEVETATRRWKMYEQQKMDLERQAADEKKKQIDEAQKKEEDWKKAAAEKAAEMAKAENDKKLQDFQDYVNKLIETVDAINKQQQGPEVNIETMGGGVASRERAERFLMQKEVDAAQDEVKKKWEGHGHRNKKGEFIDQVATEKYRQLQEQAEIELSQEFAARGDVRGANGKFDDKAVQREYERELNKRNAEIARENFKGQRFTSTGEVLDTWRSNAYAEDMSRAKKNALAESRSQIRSGSRDEQLDQMQLDFANAFIEQEGANSNLSKANVKALKQAVEASVKTKQETEKLAADVEQLQQFLAENMSSRRQAQRKNY